MIYLLFLFIHQAYSSGHPLLEGKPLGEKKYFYQLKASRFSTSSVFDENGSELTLSGTNSYTQTDVMGSLQYGYSDKLSFFGGLNYRTVSATYTESNAEITSTNSGLESYHLGLDYFFKKEKKSTFSAYLRASGTTYDNTNYANTSSIPTNEIVLGDSGNTYSVGGRYVYQKSANHFYRLDGAFRMPANDLSSEFPFKIESVWDYSRWGFLVGLGGIYSLSNSDYQTSSARPIQATRVSGEYNSHNRSMLQGNGGVFYKPSRRWMMGLEASQVLQGKSVDNATRFGLVLSFSPDGESKKEKEVKATRQAFKEYRIEGQVLKVSPRGKFVRVNVGLSSDVTKGSIFDFYETDFYGGNTLVARGVAYEVSVETTIIKLLKLYQNKRVDKGMTARAK